jgi:hypothetical protein
MPLHFEDQLISLCSHIDLILEQIDDLRGRGTTIFELRDGVHVDVTDEWLQELEYFLDHAAAQFEKLLADHRNSGGELAG